jgi:hypothetical protein
MREWYEKSFMDRFIDKLVVAFLIAGIVAIIFIVGLGVMLLVASLTGTICNEQWSDYEHRYSIMTGCLVKTDSGFVPEENVLVTDDGIIVTVES